MSPHLFLSLRPEFASKILAGAKTVEFRRTRPRVHSGQPVIVYAASPVMAIVGVATVVRVDTASPTRLWSLFGGVGGITRSMYRDYFKDAREAHAIILTSVVPLPASLDLAGIREVIPNFQPPQGFYYMDVEDALALGLPTDFTLP